MKRTPVLIDVNGVPLRESLSYNGGGAGFGGQMAELLPPARAYVSYQLPPELALVGDAGDRDKKFCR